MLINFELATVFLGSYAEEIRRKTFTSAILITLKARNLNF